MKGLTHAFTHTDFIAELALGALAPTIAVRANCRLPSDHDVLFPRNSAVISPEQYARLDKWTTHLKADHPLRGSVGMVANAEATEDDLHPLAKKRELAV